MSVANGRLVFGLVAYGVVVFLFLFSCEGPAGLGWSLPQFGDDDIFSLFGIGVSGMVWFC